MPGRQGSLLDSSWLAALTLSVRVVTVSEFEPDGGGGAAATYCGADSTVSSSPPAEALGGGLGFSNRT